MRLAACERPERGPTVDEAARFVLAPDEAGRFVYGPGGTPRLTV
jgi:hypothetical protein